MKYECAECKKLNEWEKNGVYIEAELLCQDCYNDMIESEDED